MSKFGDDPPLPSSKFVYFSVSLTAWPQIYPATRQESAKNPWGRLSGSWLEIALVFLWKTSGYLLPAKVAIEKAGLGSFM